MNKNDSLQGTLFPELEPIRQPQKEEKKKTKRQTKPGYSPEYVAELEKKIRELEAENESLKDKAEAFDELISSKSLFTTTVVAKSLGKSAIWLNQYLSKKKVQFLQGRVWVLYSKYQSMGYTQICWYEYSKDTGAQRAHTYWTAKGIQFIRDLLKKDGLI